MSTIIGLFIVGVICLYLAAMLIGGGIAVLMTIIMLIVGIIGLPIKGLLWLIDKCN